MPTDPTTLEHLPGSRSQIHRDSSRRRKTSRPTSSPPEQIEAQKADQKEAGPGHRAHRRRTNARLAQGAAHGGDPATAPRPAHGAHLEHPRRAKEDAARRLHPARARNLPLHGRRPRRRARCRRRTHAGQSRPRHPQRTPASGSDDRLLVQPLQRLPLQRDRPDLHPFLRTRRHPPACTRQIPRPAAGDGAAPRDARLSRQLAEHRSRFRSGGKSQERPEARRPRPQRKLRQGSDGAAHRRRQRRLYPGRRHQPGQDPHRLDHRSSRIRRRRPSSTRANTSPDRRCGSAKRSKKTASKKANRR